MDSIITARAGRVSLPLWIDNFSSGEVNVRIEGNTDTAYCQQFMINALIKDSDGVMAVLLLNDAIKRMFGEEVVVDLNLMYVPYGRQDRVCNHGEAFALKVFASLINSANFNTVHLSDPHSYVTEVLIDRCHVTNQVDCFRNTFGGGAIAKAIFRDYVVVSPDAGALKKATEVAKALGKDMVVSCEKVRNPQTMEIVSTTAHFESNTIQKALIVDDICDGGRTFIQLSKVLKEKGVDVVDLYVTHGIFSRGKTTLLEHIQNIYCYYDWTKGD